MSKYAADERISGIFASAENLPTSATLHRLCVCECVPCNFAPCLYVNLLAMQQAQSMP